MQATVSFILILCCVTIHASVDLVGDVAVVVPEYADVGGSATLTCNVKGSARDFYFLKWYHNDTEFYSYFSRQQTEPVRIIPTKNFVLHEMFRNQHRVVLNLSQLTTGASGHYRCEILGDAPTFRFVSFSASMTVLEEPMNSPVIVGVKESYDPDDVIEIECQPLRPSTTRPRPSIKWYLNGQMVSPNRLFQKDDKIGVVLRLRAQEVLDAGGSSEAECRLILGNHQEKTSKILNVRKGSNDDTLFHITKIFQIFLQLIKVFDFTSSDTEIVSK